jgi:periplasmic protein TonB
MLLAIEKNEENDDEPRSLLGWLVPASIGLHVVAVLVMPGATSLRRGPPPPLVVEMAEPPPAPTPPPPPPERAPTPEKTSAPARTAAPAAPARARTETPPAATAQSEAPVDFTGTSFSNDGPGVAVAQGPAPAAPGPVAAPAAPRRPAPVDPGPTFVPAASLGRPPRAPGLDTQLERNYPAEARRSGISGTAVLRVQLLPDGRVGKVERVSESYSGFGEACERTVRGGRWEPPLDREGRPVGTEIKYVCKFEVRS